MKKTSLSGIIFCLHVLILLPTGSFAQSMLINHTSTDLSQIPDQWLSQAKSDLHIVYQHTSHGSQLITGMNTLQNFSSYGTKYTWSDSGAAGALDLDDYGIPGCADLSQGDYIDAYGVTPWVTATRTLLNNPVNSHVNVVVWSWCSINGHNAQRYVDNMEILVAEYPAVKFIFMTGHAEGQGEDLTPKSVHYNNQLIRQHCATNNRILFDFADIEAYNPDGAYFWNLALYDNLDYSGGNWATQWIAAHPTHELTQLTSACSGCAHSDSPTQANLNCVLKGRAAWWLWARLAGWDGNQTPADSDGDGIVDSSDNCPAVCNPQQLDADSDGAGDLCDTTPGCGGCGQAFCEQSCDIDNDGILNAIDNCPTVCNPQQLDADSDGVGDLCDTTPGCGGCGQALCEQQCSS